MTALEVVVVVVVVVVVEASHTTSHATVDSSHTVLSATMASGIGMHHLLRINVGGQASPSAAICFKAPSIKSVTTVKQMESM